MRFGTGPGDGYQSRSTRGHYKGLEAARMRVDRQQRKQLRRPFWRAVWGGMFLAGVVLGLLFWNGVLG